MKTDNKSSAPDSFGPLPQAFSDRAGFLLNHAAYVIRCRTENALAPLNMTPRQYSILELLSTEGSMSQIQMGDRLKVDRTTMMQIIDSLEALEAVVREPHPEDRRCHLLCLTPRGKKLLQKSRDIIQQVQDEFLRAITDDEWKELRRVLIKLFENQPTPSTEKGCSC